MYKTQWLILQTGILNKQTRQKLQLFKTFPWSLLQTFIPNTFLSFSFVASHQLDKVLDSPHFYHSFLLLFSCPAPAWDHNPSPQGWLALAGSPTVRTSVSFNFRCCPPLLATRLYRLLLPQLSPWFTLIPRGVAAGTYNQILNISFTVTFVYSRLGIGLISRLGNGLIPLPLCVCW